MSLFLVLIVPALAGALIGYVTNAVAIKMLFRPLREIRILGIKIPFTPGILPRRRHILAEAIGGMVERELITPEIIGQRLRREDVREGVKTAVAGYTENLSGLPLSRLLSGINGDGDVAEVLAFFFQGLLNSPALESAVNQALDRFFFKAGLWELFGERQITELRENLERIIASALKTEGEGVFFYLNPLLEQAFPRLRALFIQFLEREDIRGELEVQGRIFLANAILKLSVFQRFFISAGQYDRTLHERMPEIIDDLITQIDTLLQNAAIRDRIIKLFQQTLRDILAEKNTLEGLARFVMEILAARLDKPLGEIIRDLSSSSAPLESPGRKILLFIRKNLGPAGEFLKKLGEYPLRDLLLIDREKKEMLDSLIRDRILALAEVQIGSALGSIDIKTMVTERIDSLEMIKVERIVLDVIGRELKWINLFGAILGALIGLFQAVFSWFARSF
ncbi:MAG: DUF445 family protein [Treponema sp.]|jgi:uncharacterized membrane protein YheB (UPF0754 family)|nr:DUF445 family protein [Treponema sp.]